MFITFSVNVPHVHAPAHLEPQPSAMMPGAHSSINRLLALHPLTFHVAVLVFRLSCPSRLLPYTLVCASSPCVSLRCGGIAMARNAMGLLAGRQLDIGASRPDHVQPIFPFHYTLFLCFQFHTSTIHSFIFLYHSLAAICFPFC